MHLVLTLSFAFIGVRGDVNKVSVKGISKVDEPLQPSVNTPSGEIRGSWMTSRKGNQFESYRGIRYAEPPVGDLKFQPPQPILKYSEEVDASLEGPACPQPTESDNYVVDEDCLRLNVYTRTTNCSKLNPVVVYIHAGGFYSASGRSDEAGPHYLMDHGMVFVAINYRLGTLGFLSTGDSIAPGNNGLKDQVAALRWVKRNIASFCGDPNLVTLTGYSAGSISVALHLVSPMSKGLFHRARAMSGSPFLQTPTPHQQYHLAERQAKLVGCPTSNSSAIMNCLKKVHWKKLADSLTSMFEFGFDPILLWLPVIEEDFGQERFLEESPVESVRKGKMQSIPLMVGQTRDEFFWKALSVIENSTLLSQMEKEWERIAPISFQLPPEDSARISLSLRNYYLPNTGSKILNDSVTIEGLGKLYSDAVIGYPVHRMVHLLGNYSKLPIFEYLFDYSGNRSFNVDPNTKKPRGVAHHDDLIYFLSLRLLFPDVSVDSSDDSKMVDMMTLLMYQFAKYGDPNGANNIAWPQLTSDFEYLALNLSPSIQKDLFKERYNFWDHLYPI